MVIPSMTYHLTIHLCFGSCLNHVLSAFHISFHLFLKPLLFSLQFLDPRGQQAFVLLILEVLLLRICQVS